MNRFANPVTVIRDFTLFMWIMGGIAAWMKLSQPEGAPLADLAPLVWLAGPMLLVVPYMILGKWGGEAGFGFRPVAAARWHGLAIALPLVLGGLLLALSLAFGAGIGGPVDPVAATAFVGIVITTLIKNVLEEIYWRGLLTTQFARTGLPRLASHLLTGLIWASWHLPYWLVLLSPEDIASASGLSVAAFVFVGFIILPLQAVLYGELRLRAKSIWPGYILHTLSNIFAFALPLIGFVRLEGVANVIVSPETHGVLYALVFAAIGIDLLRRR